ncbi:PIH1 domain-containing protein 1-like [Limulus polyphemus]|uniref:PIH1 domain-containing protein 1 n=1 Tax=Limulus polyphemus TaxID=6850 RepID=A0ABM1C5C8_LIMPO|nr:PIH1 domain-containing protein 1-like [Limulus polyphemus]
MARKGGFLDVPDIPNRQTQQFFSEITNEMKDLFSVIRDEPEKTTSSKSIKPDPGFCIKTKDSNEEKIFLNICCSPELPEPKEISEDELLCILQSDDPSTYRIPMSLGEPHVELDKSGHPCTAYDIIINKTFFKKVINSDLFKTFMITLCMEGIENKYNLCLNKVSWMLLKNKKYHGTMPDHHIRCNQKTLITEISSSNEPNKSASLEKEEKTDTRIMSEISGSAKRKNVPVPEFSILKDPVEGHPEFLVARIQLYEVKNGKDIELDLGEDRIILRVQPDIYYLDVFIPYDIQQEESGAQFDKQSKVLTITMPVVPLKNKS